MNVWKRKKEICVNAWKRKKSARMRDWAPLGGLYEWKWFFLSSRFLYIDSDSSLSVPKNFIFNHLIVNTDRHQLKISAVLYDENFYPFLCFNISLIIFRCFDGRGYILNFSRQNISVDKIFGGKFFRRTKISGASQIFGTLVRRIFVR